jgi:hypothetical protein
MSSHLLRSQLTLFACFAVVVFAACGSGSSGSSSSGSAYNNLNPNVLPPGVNVPSTAAIVRNAQAIPGWQTCIGTCANAPVPLTYTLTQNVTSPSLNNDATAASYSESGTDYGDVMWYYHLGNSQATHFVIDFYLMIDHPENVQALEFAVLKNDGLNWYKGSTQCNYQSGNLRGFNVQSFQWVSLGASCEQVQANTWQRVTLQYSIANGAMNFEGVSFNGSLQPISVSLPPEPQNAASELLGIHLQLDNANTTAGYTVYVDDWSVYSW